MQFNVIDLKTGINPDVERIALEEDWAKNLVYCDIDGFYLGQDGELILVDDCGNCATCPAGRFKIEMEFETVDGNETLTWVSE